MNEKLKQEAGKVAGVLHKALENTSKSSSGRICISTVMKTVR